MHQTLHLYLVKITCLGCARYELRAWTPAAHSLHKQADSAAAASER